MSQELIAILDLSLLCNRDVMGCSEPVRIGPYTATFSLPFLPDWIENQTDPLHMPLLAPKRVENWKQGGSKLNWGSPVSYPSGVCIVEHALLVIAPSLNDSDQVVSDFIYNNLEVWLTTFMQFVVLQTKQGTFPMIEGNLSDSIRIYSDQPAPQMIPNTVSNALTVILSTVDHSVNLSHFRLAIEWTSQGLIPKLEYLLILESYSARIRGDFRTAVIEAAVALEVGLTSCITATFKSMNITFGDALLKKYKTLGGRIELAKILGIELPSKLEKSVNQPRNNVTHEGLFATKQMANDAIASVEAVLSLLSPDIPQF